MEEAELLKERLLAITDKRKLQEEIAQRRLQIEEGKLKLHHLKKKTMREKWLLDGINTMSPEEQQDMLRQNQEDQNQMKVLEHIIGRLEQEIEDLEKQETQLSAKEVRVLQRLKSVERTTADIIRAVKTEVRLEPVKDIYAGIPDLPPSYKPTFVRKMESAQLENGDEPRKALFAMEIKVEKDMKTGKNIVLSSIPLPSSQFKDAGVKVYDDGRKSVFEVSSEGKPVKSEVESLAPIEVEDLLKKATEKSTLSPTEYHEPVFSNPYNSSSIHKGQVQQNVNGHSSPVIVNQQNGHSPTLVGDIVPKKQPVPEVPVYSQPKVVMLNGQSTHVEPQLTEDHNQAVFVNTRRYNTNHSTAANMEDDIQHSVVHATPCYIDDSEPVTMIFMGYQHADENESRPLTDYEGVIRAELVIIDDDNDKEEEAAVEGLIRQPETKPEPISTPPLPNSVAHKLPKHNISLHGPQPYKNSISLEEQETSLDPQNYIPVTKQIADDDGTEDPSLTALRIRMAKLGKKVI
ncbi:PREDICTED: palmdelphin isoform X1 [Nanorana parkeri]|uniref:palmdelphin isoform X1 n=1 Tax=Nanorana parkeri TaxID=125878 RepID=UPI00085423ED|nr:PREDICTED: palmdelphin isoform X1 [Nanorana parkeri]